jgi:DNA-binding YbaB/EbfC family protein
LACAALLWWRARERPSTRRNGVLAMMPGMPDLTQIMLKAQQMQAEMERAQSSLAEAEVTGTASGGLVTAVVSGSGDLIRIRIDPSVVDPAEVETLEDLVTAAVHDARRSADEMANSAMTSVAGGLAGSLDLSSLGLGGFPGFGGPAVDADTEYDDEYDDDEDEDNAIVDGSGQGELPPGQAPKPDGV